MPSVMWSQCRTYISNISFFHPKDPGTFWDSSVCRCKLGHGINKSRTQQIQNQIMNICTNIMEINEIVVEIFLSGRSGCITIPLSSDAIVPKNHSRHEYSRVLETQIPPKLLQVLDKKNNTKEKVCIRSGNLAEPHKFCAPSKCQILA